MKAINLPKATHEGMRLEKAIKSRRCIRDYSQEPLRLAVLSQLLYSAQGITGEKHGVKLRASPSAGALFPMELYIFVRNIKNLKPGLYHYLLQNHSLELIKTGDFSDSLMKAGLYQTSLKEADMVIALSAVPGRMEWKYGNRTIRYIHIEAGHIAQNVLLQSTSLGLGAVPIGAFEDNKIDQLLGIDGKTQISVYLIAVGTVR